MMSNKKPTYEELERRLTDAEEVITTLRRGEVDAIISERNVALLRAREAEQARQQAQRRLDIKNQIADIFLTVPDDEMYGEVLQVILKAMRSRYGIFGYINERGDLVIPSMTRDIWQKCQVRDKTIVYPPENWGGIWGRALKERKTLYANRDLHVPEGHIPVVRVLVVPIMYRGELIGLLEVANKETDYDEKDKSYLETIANHIAPILNARLGMDRQERERKQAEESLRVSHQFLEIANRHSEMTPLLQEFIKVVKEWSNCAAIGIRLLDNEGNIPYEAYQGFSQTFYDSESPLSIKSDQCMCINVIKGTTDSRLSFYTEGGSFYMNATSRFLATVSEQEKGQTRNVCNASGYESVALIPIRFGNRILGLIHVADLRENMVSLALVQFLERVGIELGAAIHRVWLTQALRESEEKFRSVYERSPLGIELYNEDGELFEANRACLNIFGVSDVAQVRWSRLFADPNMTDEAKEALRQGRTVRYETTFDFDEVKKRRLYNPNRSGVIHITAFITPIGMTQEKKPGGYLVLLQDTTESKRLDELKDEFIGMVSHELSSPLTVITGSLNTLLSEGEQLSRDEVHHLLQNATSSADTLSHLLGNLLELSRAQAERLILHTEPIKVDGVVDNAVERIAEQCATQKILIDLPPGLPQVHADPLRLERILYNLLDNARKYSLKRKEIKVFAREEKNHLIIGVSDQGVGIPESDQAKIFIPFERLKPAGFEGSKGAGLGLLVCRRLVEAHGGQIWVESTPGQGSTFFFSLPFNQEA
jgi:PAS domain S-box-containing protein